MFGYKKLQQNNLSRRERTRQHRKHRKTLATIKVSIQVVAVAVKLVSSRCLRKNFDAASGSTVDIIRWSDKIKILYIFTGI